MGRPRGRRPGVSNLAQANESRGLGILRCQMCGRKLRDHNTYPCDLPPTKEHARKMAQARAATEKAKRARR